MRKIILSIFLALTFLACTSKPSQKANKTLNSPSKSNQSLAELLSFNMTKVDENKLAKFPLGSKENPIRVGGPEGERNYIKRLVCDNNEPAFSFERAGSTGLGPFGSIMDIYTVHCKSPNGINTHTIFMDMYHGNHEESRPAAGFIALKPDCWSYIRKAVQLREKKQFNESLLQIELHNQCDTSNVKMSYYYHLGWTYSEMGELNKALQAYTEGLKTEPNYLFAYWRRGLAHEKLGDTKAAKADFEKAYLIGAQNKPEEFKKFLSDNPSIAEKLLPKK